MKKLLFTILFLFVLNSNCKAEWTLVSIGEDTKNNIYLDFERIKKVDGNIYFLYLQNFPESQEFKFGTVWSSLSYAEADCKIHRFNNIEDHAYDQRMAKGLHLKQFKPKKKNWKNPVPNSLYDSLLKAVCDYKF